MIPFPFNENRFSFFVADHLLVGQLCTNTKSDRSLLSCLKVTQYEWDRTTHALYRSKLWQQDHCQYPQNANPDGSTLESTAQRIERLFGGGGAEGHRQEDPDQWVHRKCPGNHWWNTPAAYSADCQRFRRLIHNCECMWEGRLEEQVLQAPDKTDRDWEDKEPQVNQVRPEPAGLLRLVIRREHHQHDLPQHQPDRRHPPSIRRAPAGACGKACS